MKWTKHILLLVFSMLFLCSCSHKENTGNKIEVDTTIVNEQITTETSAIITTITAKTTTTTTTETNITSETTTKTDTTTVATESDDEYSQIFSAVEVVCNTLLNGYDKEPYDIFNDTEHIIYDNEIDFFMDNVSKIDNSTLGEITDEQDLISKSKEIFIEILGQDFIERVEADYYIKNVVKLAIIERTTPLYYVDYCDESDIWYIYPCMPSGKLEDGTGLDTIYEWGAFLMVRGSDGKIVACRF